MLNISLVCCAEEGLQIFTLTTNCTNWFFLVTWDRQLNVDISRHVNLLRETCSQTMS